MDYSMWYCIDNGKPRKCRTHADLTMAFANRDVKKTKVGEQLVSTVFLALDHNYTEKGPPVLFETMVFPECDICVRYCTKEEAEKGHGEVVEKLQMEHKKKHEISKKKVVGSTDGRKKRIDKRTGETAVAGQGMDTHVCQW